MFIELADHLRCPTDHDEQYLVMLPDRMDGRWVVEGQLGCPVCGRTFGLQNGAFDAGGAGSPPEAASALDADGLVALAGVTGPGGYFVLVGGVAAEWEAIAERMPGVALVAVNPPAEVADRPGVSVLRGGRLPLKRRSMRGVVLGKGYGGDPAWVREAARVVLPGLRVVGEGDQPDERLVRLMASAEGVWVGSPP